MHNDRSNNTTRLYDLGDAINPLTLDEMKDLFRRNRLAHGKPMNVSDHALQRSWAAFIKRWNEGNLLSAIESRESRHRAHSLVYLRDEVCKFCQWNDYTCLVDVEEGCWCSGSQTTRQEWESDVQARPLDGDNLDLIESYEKALRVARRANSRSVWTRIHERDRERPAQEPNVVPTYPRQEDNQAIERDSNEASYGNVPFQNRRDDRRYDQQSTAVDPLHRQAEEASSFQTVDDSALSVHGSPDRSPVVNDASYQTPPRAPVEAPSRSPVRADDSVYQTPPRVPVEAPPLQSPDHEGDVVPDVPDQVPPPPSRGNLKCLDLVVREQDQLRDQLNDTDQSVEEVQGEVADLRHKYLALQNQVQAILAQNRQMREQLGITLDAPPSKKPKQRYDRPKR